MGSGCFSVSLGSPDMNCTILNAGTVNIYVNAANIKTFDTPTQTKAKQNNR